MTPDYAKHAEQGYMGDWSRGAPMGRATVGPDPRTKAELLEDFAAAAKRKSDALRLKDKRPADGYKASAWEAAAKSAGDEMTAIKGHLKAWEARQAAALKMTLRRIRLDSGGYDSQGTYYGIGQPLYWAASDDLSYDSVFRADDRDDAKAHVRELFPAARFYR